MSGPGASAGPAPAAGRPGGGATGGIEDAGAGEPGLTARTLSGLKWAGLGAAGQALLSLAILAALARLLAPAEFGVLAIALVFITVAHALGHRNIGAAIVQRAGLTDRHIAAAVTLSVTASAVLVAALWVLLSLHLRGAPARSRE